MAQILNTKKELDEFLLTYNPHYDERLIINYKDSGKSCVVESGDYINFDNRFILYYGLVLDPKSVPNIYCFYRIGIRVYYRKPTKSNLDIKTIKPKPKEEDTSELLDVTIGENDNELMVICKELLKGMRINTFKSLFQSSSDFNNIRREITAGNGQLTWNRYLLICEILGFDHVVGAILRDGSVIGANPIYKETLKKLKK